MARRCRRACRAGRAAPGRRAAPAPHQPRLHRSAHHRRVDGARRDCVHRDAERGEIEGERLGQCDDPALRCDVVRHTPGARLRGGRRDGHDAPPLRLHHVGNGRLHAVERAGEVDRQHALPGCDVDLEEVDEALDAGARNHDPHWSTELAAGRSSAASTAARSLTSTGAATARPPSASTSLATCSVASPSMSSTATRWPCRARWWQMARPMPDPPPVTTATRLTCGPLACRLPLAQPPIGAWARPGPTLVLVGPVGAENRAGRVGRCYGECNILSTVPSAQR